MNKKKTVALLLNEMISDRVMDPKDVSRLRKIATVRTRRLARLDAQSCKELIAGADAVITSWGTPRLEEEILDRAPGLRLIAHAAGSVKPVVSDEVWKRRIRVTTTAPSIALSVADFALGMMLLYSVRTKRFAQAVAAGAWSSQDEKLRLRGLYDRTIGIMGAGYVGRRVIELLKQFPVNVLLYDPTLSTAQAAKLGARKVTMEQLCRKSDIISSHAPSIPATRHLLNERMFGLMHKDVLIVNTSRGSVIDENALVSFLKENKNAFACIDVTDPEPPTASSPLRTMENLLLTPHIAGIGATRRQGRYAVTEIENLFKGKKLVHEVKESMLATMA